MLIEQAVFTSAHDDHAAGYHLVARSPGIEEAERGELTVWGPSHDSLAAPAGSEPASVNFFRLPSGAQCISKTQIAGGEYSGRGNRTYTNCLVVPQQLLARFAANPFRILRAVAAKGLLKVYDRVPVQLPPFQLPGRARRSMTRSSLNSSNAIRKRQSLRRLICWCTASRSLWSPISRQTRSWRRL